MGIQGLLPLLKSIQRPTHLRNFAGQTLGIDAYGWLHRGTIACAIELAEGIPTRKHIEFALHRVRMLIHFGVKPYLVFDGDYLPSKAHTEKDRAARRKESKKSGLELLRLGRRSQAYQELQKAIDVTPAMARELIEELIRLDVPYVVAPYEADSQLAYLEKKGIVAGVISEDSDLLVFGVQRLLTKLDQYGECIMVRSSEFTACREVSLVGWSPSEFRMMAMLSGCDYLPGIDQLGLKTAYRLVRKHKTIERVVRSVQFDGKKKVPAGYLEDFYKAERTFLYQWVFCPEERRLLNLTPLPAGLDAADMPYIGKYVDPEAAAGVASGLLDPNTKRPIHVPARFSRPAARVSTVQTPDEKQGKPITEFFKSKRTPLAELDPNSFTPSPSQQRLMQTQRNTSWSASQIPAPGRSTSVGSGGPSIVHVAPRSSRRTLTEPLSAIYRRSPKRQRLCSEPSITAAMHGTEDPQTASRFFAHQAPQASPSLRKESRRGKREEFDLWSDDSAVEAVAAATATAEPVFIHNEGVFLPRKQKKLNVYADASGSQGETKSTGTMSQETIFTQTSASSQVVKSLVTPATSFASSQERREVCIPSKGVEGISAVLHPKAYIPALTKKTPHAVESTKASPISLATQPKIEEDAEKEEDKIVPNSSPVVPPPMFDEREQERCGDYIDDEEWLAMEKQPVGVIFQGSEDMIVPESPDQSDEGTCTRPKLDLGRYAFGA